MNTSHTTLPNALEQHAAELRARRFERILALTGALGLVAAVGALWWPTSDGPSVIVPLRPIAIPSPQPSPAAAVAEPSAPPIVLEATAVPAKAPTVALETLDREVDHAALARAALEAGELEEGLTELRKQIYVAPPTAELLLQIARTAEQLGAYALAEQALLDAGALSPERADVALERGRILLTIGALDEARTAARLAIRLDKESASAWNLAGRVAMAMSEWDRAEMAFRQAVQREPTDAMLHNNLGLLYVMTRKGELAIDALETSRELSGEDTPAFVHNNLGLAYELAGRLEDARGAFEDALMLSPDYARAQLNLRRVIAAEEAERAREEAETATAEVL